MIIGSFELTNKDPSYTVDMMQIDAAEFFIDWTGTATVEVKAKKYPQAQIEQTLATFSAPGIFRIDFPNLQGILIFEKTGGDDVIVRVEYCARARR